MPYSMTFIMSESTRKNLAKIAAHRSAIPDTSQPAYDPAPVCYWARESVYRHLSDGRRPATVPNGDQQGTILGLLRRLNKAGNFSEDPVYRGICGPQAILEYDSDCPY